MVLVANDRRWVQFGPYRADLRARELSKHGVRLKLQSRPFEILAMLLQRTGDVVTREEIRAQLWPQGTFVDFDSNISSAVRKLRDTLCDSAVEPRYIETVGRVGYRFIGQFEFSGEGPALMREGAGSTLAELVAQDNSSTSGQSSSRSTQAGTETASSVPAKPERARSAGWFTPQRFMLAFILCAGIVVGGVTESRHWLTSVRAAGHSGISTFRSSQEAVAEYSKGRELWSHRGEDNLKAAIEHFRLASEKKPDYGLAYSGLADAYMVLPFYSRFTPAEVYPKARAAALKAVELAPQSAEAHTSLAYAKLYVDWDFRGAEDEFRIALLRNPNYATGLQWHAEYLSLIGRYDDAIAEIRRAIALMPESPVIHHNAGQIYQTARRYDEAIQEYAITLRLDPTFGTSQVFMALAYMRKGMYDKAMELQLEHAEASGDATRIAVARTLAESYRSNGSEGYLRELVGIEVEENPDRDAYRIAQCYALLGEKDLAFRYLDRTYQLHASDLLSLNADPELDSLRSDPRFLALRRRIGLPMQVLEIF